MAEIVGQNHFARMCEVSKQCVSQQIKTGGIVLNVDKKVDLSNTINKKYLKKHQDRISKGEVHPRRTTEILPYNSTATHGQPVRVSVQDKARLEMEKLQIEIDLKHIKLAKERGSLVDRSTLGKWTVSHLDTLNKKLLGLPTQVVDPVMALGATKNGRQGIIDLIGKTIASHLEYTRSEMIRMLGDEANQ